MKTKWIVAVVFAVPSLLFVIATISFWDTRNKTKQNEGDKESFVFCKSSDEGDVQQFANRRNNKRNADNKTKEDQSQLRRDMCRNKMIKSSPDDLDAQVVRTTNNLIQTSQLLKRAMAVNNAIDSDTRLVPGKPLVTEIQDPVNPKPGMVFSAYGAYKWMYLEDVDKLQASLKACFSFLPKAPAVKTGVDASDKFTIDCAKGVATGAIRWEGFLQCTKARKYTFLVQKNVCNGFDSEKWQCGYAISVNGKVYCTGYGQDSFDVDLKIGFNKVEIVTLLPNRWENVKNAPLHISVRVKGSINDPIELSPGVFFYDHVEGDNDTEL